MKNGLTGLGCIAATVALVASSVVAAEPTQDALATVKKSVAEKKALLVDVREKREWDAGHVKGAIFLPLSEIRNGFTA